MSSATLNLARELIARPSITPADAGCLEIVGAHLAPLGFKLEYLRYGAVSNLWARLGTQGPLFVFAGHTDVVPTGPREQWTFDPFVPTIADGCLYGRGAADMKGSIAAMIAALERYITGAPRGSGSIGVLLTSDEEGPAVDGTRRVIDHLQVSGQRIDWCLLGEPSCEVDLGDTIRNGRRGSLNGRLNLRGVQGHVAHPHQARNPIHAFAPILETLCNTQWDTGNADFPATSFQVSNIHAGTGAENVIPGELEVRFNFRYSTASTEASLVERVKSILAAQQADYTLDWHPSGAPFLTHPGRLIQATAAAIETITGRTPATSTGGGTSDGRFIAPTGAEVIEFGPVNATIHQIDERVPVAELDQISLIFERVLRNLLG